jgi:hypothetical protein
MPLQKLAKSWYSATLKRHVQESGEREAGTISLQSKTARLRSKPWQFADEE